MNNNLERAKDLLPAIILTILSMIQALALELYWSRIEDSAFLWLGGLEAVVGWLQLLVMLLGILLIWVFYVSFVLRFRWLPTVQDMLIPFVIGLLEFALIDLTGAQLLWAWFPLLGALLAVATYGSHLTLRQARQDPANDYFFSKVSPSSWNDYRATLISVLIYCIIGGVLWFTDDDLVLGVVALLTSLAVLGYRFYQANYYWMHSIEPGN